MEIYGTTPPKDDSDITLPEETTATKHDKFPLLIIVAGVLFSLFLYWHIQDELFFSGDGGLKALLAKQFSAGNFRFDLALPADSWVRDLWNQGLYPFEPPFAYKITDLYYITFPFTFPLITAPFYAIFGFRGLYIVPLVATWSLWIGFYFVCRHFKLGSAITSIAIAALIFASPLTMYSSMYWEHTLAVSLAFSGVAILLVRGCSRDFSARDAVLSGILIGLSVWFREELLCLVVIIFVLVAASWKLNLGHLNLISEKKIFFILSMMLTVVLFLGINTIIYHHPLGIHSIQVVEKLSLGDRVSTAYGIFRRMTEELFNYFPIIYFCIIYIALAWLYSKNTYLNVIKKLLLLCTVFTVFVSLVLPSDGGKQWGPRFLLTLIPFICLLAAMALYNTWKIKKFGLRYISFILFAIFFGIGVHINSYLGTIYCYPQRESTTVTTLKLLRQDKNKVVASPNQYVNQTFESLFDKKAFFLTKKSADLTKLGRELQKQGYKKFIYVCPSYDRCYPSKNKTGDLEFVGGGKPPSIEFLKLKNIEEKTEKIAKQSGRIEKKLIGNIEKKLRENVNYMIYEASVIDGSEKTNGSLKSDLGSSTNQTNG